MPALDLQADDYTPPEPAPSPYLLTLAELARPPASLPDEVAARLAAAARRRKISARRKLSVSIARGRRVLPTAPPAPMPPEARPLPAHAVPRVEVPDTAANRLKAIRGALRDLRNGAPVNPAELVAPLRLLPDLLKEIRSDDPFRSSLALAVAEAFVAIEVEKEKALRASRKNSNQFTRRPAPPALGCPDVI
jgi:hypothetical protein